MGSCSTKDQNSREEWNCISRNFNSGVFYKYVNKDQFLAYQRFLNHFWEKYEFKNYSQNFNQDICSELKFWVLKGAPNHLISKIIQEVIPLKHTISLDYYINLHKNIDDSDIINYQISPNFNCNEDNWMMLSSDGKIVYKRIFYFIENHLNLKYCFMLSFIVQFLIWYLLEHDAFYVIYILYQNDCLNKPSPYYFIKTQEQSTEIIKRLTEKLVKIGGSEQVINEALSEMLSTGFKGFISPMYYSLILVNFIVGGYEAILKMSMSLFDLIDYTGIQSIEDLKTLINTRFNYIKFIQLYSETELDNF